MTNQTQVGDDAPGTTWMYDVWVYPKNAVVGNPFKNVFDQQPYELGTANQYVDFKITADFPRLPGDPNIGAETWGLPNGYMITDELDDAYTLVNSATSVDFAKYDAPVVTITTGTPVVLGMPGAACIQPSDSGWDQPSNGYILVEGDDNEFAITLCPGGLKALQAAAGTADARVTVDFTVKVANDVSGLITNVAKVYPNLSDMGTAGTDNDRGLPTDAEGSGSTPDTLWGEIDITKKGQAGDSTYLDGAEFQLFNNYDDAKAATTGQNVRGATFESGKGSLSDGQVLITGLRASDHIDGVSGVPAGTVVVDDQVKSCEPTPGYIVYWLTETKAPTGYELLANPIPVVLTVVDDGDGNVTSTLSEVALNADGTLKWTELGEEEAGAACSYQVTTGFDSITNVQKNAGFKLPLTGGMGTIWLMIAGGALLAVVLVVARRRRAEEA